MKKRSLWAMVMFLSMFQVQASVFKLGDILVKSVDLKTKIITEGISGASVNRLKTYIDTSVDSLMSSQDRSLYDAVRSLPVASDDKLKKAALLQKLSKNSDEVRDQDFIEAVNDLIYLADRYGMRSSTTLSCSVCVTDQLSSHGLKTSIRKIGQPELISQLKRIPKSNRSLVLFNKNLAKKLKIEDEFRYLREDEHKAMAFFLQVAAKSKGEYQKLSQAILEFNKVNGKVHLAGPQANSKLWKLFTSNLSESKAQKLSEIISKASAQKDISKRKEVFYSELEMLSKGDNTKLDKVNSVRKQDCFFK